MILLVLCSSCAMFESRDYFDQMSDYKMEDRPLFRANDDFMVIAGDSGRYSRTNRQIRGRTPSSSSDNYDFRYQESLKGERSKLENKLTDTEFYEFDKSREDIGSVSEQIYFLRLREDEKAEYLNIRNISSKRSQSVRNRVTPRASFREPAAIYVGNKDVVLGMPMERVLEEWGTPLRRDIAGSKSSQNERWAFRRNGTTKYIYFESGIVQGWSEN